MPATPPASAPIAASKGSRSRPDGRYVYAMLQSAMLDEGGGNGVLNRIVKFDTCTGAPSRSTPTGWRAASQGRGISALVALNDHELLVLERNNRGLGVDAELTPAEQEGVPHQPDRRDRRQRARPRRPGAVSRR